MATAQKIDLAFQTSANNDLKGFFAYVNSLKSLNDRRAAVQKAGYWYGNTNCKSLPVDPIVKANAYKDLKAFFNWINTQSDGNRVVNLMKAGLWYGDAGNTSFGTYVLYGLGAAAVITTAIIAGPDIITALGAGGTKIKTTAKQVAAETIKTSTVTAETVKKNIDVSALILDAAKTAQSVTKVKESLSGKNTSTVLTEQAAKNLDPSKQASNDLTDAEAGSVFADFENALHKGQTAWPYILAAVIVLFFIVRGK